MNTMQEMEQADDLKAFERRMLEIVSYSMQRPRWCWRIILIILGLITLATSYGFIKDILFSWSMSTSSVTELSTKNEINNEKLNLSRVLSNLFRKNICFFFSLGSLLFALLFGMHRKRLESSTIIARFRYILYDYNMSCDLYGRLIIKPRPATHVHRAS